jgi:hypothetical protein
MARGNFDSLPSFSAEDRDRLIARAAQRLGQAEAAVAAGRVNFANGAGASGGLPPRGWVREPPMASTGAIPRHSRRFTTTFSMTPSPIEEEDPLPTFTGLDRERITARARDRVERAEAGYAAALAEAEYTRAGPSEAGFAAGGVPRQSRRSGASAGSPEPSRGERIDLVRQVVAMSNQFLEAQRNAQEHHELTIQRLMERQTPPQVQVNVPATETITPEALAQLREFDGADGADGASWIEELETVAEAYGWRANLMRRAALALLRGCARDWQASFGRTVLDWGAWRAEFLAEFGRAPSAERWLRQVAERVWLPGETLQAYARAKQRLCQKGPFALTEAETIKHLLSGISDRTCRVALITARHQTLRSFYEHVKELDELDQECGGYRDSPFRTATSPSFARRAVDGTARQQETEYRQRDSAVDSVARDGDRRGLLRSVPREANTWPPREDPRPYSNVPVQQKDPSSDRLEELCERMERALARQAEFMERSSRTEVRPSRYVDFTPTSRQRSPGPQQQRWAEGSERNGDQRWSGGEVGPPVAGGRSSYSPRPVERGGISPAETKVAGVTDQPAEGPRESGLPSASGAEVGRERPPSGRVHQVTFADPRPTPSGYGCWTCGQPSHRSYDCPYGRGAEGGAVPKRPSGNWRAGLERQGRP